MLEVTAALCAEESVSKVASCSIIPGLETLHIIFLIKSLTIPYVCNEGRPLEGEEDVRKCEREKKEGQGEQKRDSVELGGVRKIQIKEDKETGRLNRRMRATGKAEDR